MCAEVLSHGEKETVFKRVRESGFKPIATCVKVVLNRLHMFDSANFYSIRSHRGYTLQYMLPHAEKTVAKTQELIHS